MARTWTLALAASLLASGVAAAQDDPIGDLLGGPSLSPAEARPAPATAAPEAAAPAEAAPPLAAPTQPAPAVQTAPHPELDEEGEVIPPPAPSASTPTPPPVAAASPESQPALPTQATAAPQASAPQRPTAPPAQVPAQQSYAAPAPTQAAPPVANLPTGPIPYQALTPSPAAPPSYAPATPYARPTTPYAQPAAPYASSPAPPPTYSPSPYPSPPMGLASAPPPSTGVQTGARSPVHIDEHGRTPDAAPTYRELDYEQRLRSSYASAQGLQGPLDGGWTLSVDGDERYFLQLVERSSGLLEGVWRDLRRTGALNGSGFVEGIQRYGGQLSFSVRPDGRDELATATLTAGPDGKWSGELVRGRDRKSITLRRN